MKPNYFIVQTGIDCDGWSASNRNIACFYSRKYADKICNQYAEHSDGITMQVVTYNEFKKHFEEPNMNFYYMPFIGNPYFDISSFSK